MTKLMLFILIVLFSFHTNANDFKKYNILELKQPKYQILKQDTNFSDLLSRWAAIDNKKIEWNSFLNKKIYKEDLVFNKKMYGAHTFQDAILIFLNNFESLEYNLHYFIFKKGDIVLVVYDQEHFYCKNIKDYNSKEEWDKSIYKGKDYNELKKYCQKNNLQ